MSPVPGPFDAWLENKTRQRAEQRQVEKLRAQIITSELLSVDYSESELAYERSLLIYPLYNCLRFIGGPISDSSDFR